MSKMMSKISKTHLIAAFIIIALVSLMGSCIIGTPTVSGAGYPYIQSITAQVMAAGAASPIATATEAATATATSSATSTEATPTTSVTTGVSPTVSPTPGGFDVMVSIETANFQVVDMLGQAAVEGQGHVHYFLDAVPPIVQSTPAVSIPGTVVEIPATSYTWPNVAPGLHFLSAELVNNDHTPLSAPAVATVMVWVPDTASAMMPQIPMIKTQIMTGAAAASAAATLSSSSASSMPEMTSAASETSMPSAASASASATVISTGTNIRVSIQPANFNVVAKEGQAAATGEGHVHFFLDTLPPTFPYQVSVPASGMWVHTENLSQVWTNVQPGVHILVAELVNNDHTALNPPVVAAALVTVMPSITGASPTASAAASPTATASPSVTASPSATASPSITASPSASATATAAGGNAVTIDLTAQNVAFDKSTITVPAGAQVTINFNNQDNGIPHNFAVYTDSSASQSIFVGQTITGPDTTTYTFTAPSTAGTYFFRCDVHPTQMTGQFIVQ